MLRRITSGRLMHEPEVLGAILKSLGRPLPVELVRRFRRARWSTALRYETARGDTGETRGFLKTAKATYEWVEEQLP